MIKASLAKHIGTVIKKSNQSALHADGITPRVIVGETHIMLSRDNIEFALDAYLVNELDVDILAGILFMSTNDISVRPAKQQILIGDTNTVHCGTCLSDSPNRVSRTQAYILKPEATSVIWPRSYLELALPSDLQPECTLAIETRTDNVKFLNNWPPPSIKEAVSGKVCIPNNTDAPLSLRKNKHFCQVRLTAKLSCDSTDSDIRLPEPPSPTTEFHSDTISVDPDKILLESNQTKFRTLTQAYNDVFDTKIQGYNGSIGPFEATTYMGAIHPPPPPKRKGRVPQCARNKLLELHRKFGELENQGVFARPESLGITAEYLNPSFLEKKPSGGSRLVTAFAEEGRYSKPQPSLMPDVDSALRSIARWKYLITSDLTSAFYQIPLSKSSMKYCRVATPYRGIRVYTRCATGMPGSEMTLEELMFRILGNCIQDRIVAKLADDLYCGGNTLNELLSNWKRVLDALQKSNLKLSPSKTVICPRSTTILGWIWTQGVSSASPHKVAVLVSVGSALLSALIRFSVEYNQTALPILPHWKVQLLDISSKTRLFGQMIYIRSFIAHKKLFPPTSP